MIKKLKGLYIILLFAILIFAYYGYRYFDRPKNVMTLNEVLDLVDSSNNYYNFRVKYTSKSSGSDIKMDILNMKLKIYYQMD